MLKKINVSGMSCEHCVRHVTNALEELPGVKDVTVTLKTNSATADLGNNSDEAVKAAIADAGYTVTSISNL